MADTDWYAEITKKATPAAAPALSDSKPTSDVDWYKEVTSRGDGTEMRNQPPGTRMGSVLDDPTRAASAATIARASLAPDVNDQIKRFATARGIPTERYGVINGNIVFDDGQGNLVREVPSVEGANGPVDAITRAGKYVSAQAGPAIPTAAGMATGIAMGPTGMSIPASGGAAAMADAGRQFLDRLIAGEDPTKIDWLNAAGHGVMNALPQAGAVGLTKAFTSNPLGVAAADRVGALDPQKRALAQAVVEAGRKRGIDVFVDEATGLPSLRQQARQLRRYPETADMYGEAMDVRNRTQIPTGARQEFDNLGKLRTAEDAVGGAQTAAKGMIEGAQEARTAAATPYYESAFNSGAMPDTSSTLGIIQDHLANVARGSQSEKALKQAEGFLMKQESARVQKPALNPQTGQMEMQTVEETRLIPEGDYRRLHSAKLNIDKMLDGIADGTLSVDKETARALTMTQRDLTKQLRAAHPEYEAGYQKFISMSPAIEELEKGGVGVLARKTGSERAVLLDDIFNGTRSTPEATTKARQAFMLAGKKSEWDDALRYWLEDKLAASQKTANTGNAIAKGLWDDPRQRAVIEAAIGDKGKFASLSEFFDVINAVRKALPEGAPTATDLGAGEVAGKAGGAALKLVGKGLSPMTYANIGNEVVEGVQALRAPEARRKLAEAFMDPDSLKTLNKLRLLPPRGEKAMTVVGEFLTNALAAGTGARQPADREPASLK